MLDLSNNILLTIAFLNIILGFLILRRNWKDPINFSYLLLTITIVLWSLSLFLFRSVDTDASILLSGRLVYSIAAFLPLFFLFFVFSFAPTQTLRTKLYLGLLIIPTIFFAVMSYISELVAVRGFSVEGLNQLQFGEFYQSYLLYLSIYFTCGIIYLVSRYRIETDSIKKLQYYLILLGTSITIVISITTNGFLLTTFAFKYNWVGPLGTLAMMVFFAYAIVQYKLFNIKVVSTQIFSGALAGILFVKLLSSNSGTDLLVNAVVFVSSVIVTILLIRGVLNEVRTREEVQRLAKDLEYANVELKRLDQAKSEFISIASHQLRTPLSIIKGYISMIREGSYGIVPDSMKKTLNKIYLSNERLVKLVADLLDLSRMESGKMKYEYANFNFIELVDSIVDEFKMPATDKGLDLRWDAPADPLMVWGDSWKLRQVIFNLIDNSLKYTEKGWIEVTIQPSSDLVTLAVKDSGIGMSQDTARALFQKFSRGHDSSKVNVQGLGLGLFIAKKIMDDHRGKLWPESEGEGKGSTFFFQMPIKQAPPAPSTSFDSFITSI